MAGIYENLIDECRVIAREGKIPADKDAEQAKIKKLTEVIELDTSGMGDDELVAKYEELERELDWARKGIPGAVVTGSELYRAVVFLAKEIRNRKLDIDVRKYLDESKVNEQDKETPAPEDVKIEPEEEKEAPEITKEYLGKTEDTHFYIVSTDEPEDLQILDQEGVMKYSAKDNNLEVTDIPAFLIQAIQDVEINAIERSIFVKYILPLLLEEEEEFEEEEEEEEPKEEEEPRRESKKVGEKKKAPLCSKCNKRHWPFKPCSSGKKKESKVSEAGWFERLLGGLKSDKKFAKLVKEYGADSDEVHNYVAVNYLGGSTKQTVDDLVKWAGSKIPEGKIPADKDAEQAKIKKLIEMKVRDDEDNEFEVTLVDDGTIDTVIGVNGREFRFSPEFASYWKNEEGTISEDGLEEMALDALSNLEESEYNELVAKKEEIEAAPSEEETSESKVEETKLNDITSTILGVLRSRGDESSFEELRDYLRDLNTDDYNDLVQAVELGNKDEIADIMKSVGFTESKVNEGLESHVDSVLEDAGFIKGKHYEWSDGLKVYDEKDALPIINVLAKSGEFGPAYYENGKINFTSTKGIFGESKIAERDIKNMSEDELRRILDHLEKVTRIGFDVKGRMKEIKDELSSRPIEETNEDYRQVRPGEYEVTFYDGTTTTLPAESAVDAKEKAKVEGGEKRVLNVRLIKQTDSRKDVQVESKTNETDKKKPGAKVRQRGDCVFPAESSKVTDDKDHFPINDAAQARNALARANQYSSAPKWYKGSLELLVKKVANAVHKKYPSIEISKAAKKPGKESKESGTNESLDETKQMGRLNNLLGL